MKLLIFIVLGMLVCWEATDVVADDILSAVLAPIGLVFFFFWGIGWLLVKAFRRGGAGGGSAAASLGDFGDFGGGD